MRGVRGALALALALLMSAGLRPQSAAAARASRTAQLRHLQGVHKGSKQLHILAFGDSLTVGFESATGKDEPYSWQLSSCAKDHLGGGWSIDIVNGGIGGAGVLDKLGPAFLSDIKQADFNYIVFMAGINDLLGSQQKAQPIFNKMKELWSAGTKTGATIIIIPTLPTSVSDWKEDERKKLDQLIRGYVRRQNARGNIQLVLLDLSSEFNYQGLSQSQRDKLWGPDGLHLQPAGYQKIGNAVCGAILKDAGM